MNWSARTVLIAIAVVLFVLHGLNVSAPQFNPFGFGMACAVAALAVP